MIALPGAISKTCTKCGEAKPISEFASDRRASDHLQSGCRRCGRTANNQRYASRKHILQPLFRERYRTKVMPKKYGITAEQYDTLVARQRGLCGICAKPERGNKSLAVDHDHKTGKVRGLLCGDCNQAIGKLGDDLDGVLRAVGYLVVAAERRAE